MVTQNDEPPTKETPCQHDVNDRSHANPQDADIAPVISITRGRSHKVQSGLDQNELSETEIRARLEKWRNMPVDISGQATQAHRSQVRLSQEDGEIDSITDPLVNIEEYGIEGSNYYSIKYPDHCRMCGISPSVHLRESVLKSLQKIDQSLRKVGLKLKIVDGWRHMMIQQYSRYWFIGGALANIKGTDEEKMAKRREIFDRANNQFSNPDFTAPHLSGGAFDVEIIEISTGKRLPCKPFEILGEDGGFINEKQAMEKLSTEEYRLFNVLKTTKAYGTGYRMIEAEIKKISAMTPEERRQAGISEKFFEKILIIAQNRRMLYRIFTTPESQEGFLKDAEIFTGNPSEYWHYGRGDRASAVFKGKTVAQFGFVSNITGSVGSEEEELAHFQKESEEFIFGGDEKSLEAQDVLLHKILSNLNDILAEPETSTNKDYLLMRTQVMEELSKIRKYREKMAGDSVAESNRR